jgi:hypothetical protein
MAASDHVLPPPFSKWMSKLQDQAKLCDYEVIAKPLRNKKDKQYNKLLDLLILFLRHQPPLLKCIKLYYMMEQK